MLALAILLYVGFATAGVLNPFDSKIVGGLPAKIEDFPHQASVQVNTRHICGGSIIGPNHILTAAHCTYGRKPSSMGVRVGSTSRSWSGSFHNAVEIIQHPKYDPSTVDYDFSILKVSPAIVFDDKRQKVELADKEPSSNVDILLSGWGTTSEGGSSTDTLLYTEVKTISRDDCASKYAGKSITNRMICAWADGKDSCQGDSGGPMIDKKTKKQYGVVSWGIGCARPNYPGVYANIADQRAWIKEMTGI